MISVFGRGEERGLVPKVNSSLGLLTVDHFVDKRLLLKKKNTGIYLEISLILSV